MEDQAMTSIQPGTGQGAREHERSPSQSEVINAVDEALVRRGQLAPDQVRVYETEALVDTGAVRCALPPFVADRLGLARVTRYMAQYADGWLEEVDLTEGFVLEIRGRRMTEEALLLGDSVVANTLPAHSAL